MSTTPSQTSATPESPASDARPLSEAARRALAEAEARRAAAGPEPERPVEHLGPKGAEPTRFGDWEKKGITSDF